MMRCLLSIFCVFLLNIPNVTISKGQDRIHIAKLSCQYQKNPLGIESIHPLLSWKMESGIQGQKQTAYQVLVASQPDLLNDKEADLWNSGKVISSQSIAVRYQGKKLQSRRRCYWKVRVWDRAGMVSEYSELQFWEMGLLTPEDWQARWIKHPDFMDTTYQSRPAPFFRRKFTLHREIESARVYVTGLGYFEMYLNGKKVGDHVLDPVKTRYDKVVKYLVYDVKSYLKAGNNALGIILGTGWYNHFAKAVWQFDQAPWRDYPTLICQLEIKYEDGSSQTIVSDNSWKCKQGPIIFDGIRNGEYYDARLEMPDWDQPWYNDRDWHTALEVPGPKGQLKAQKLPPIKEMKEITPVSITEIKPGVFVFDLGQNMAGYCRLKIAGPAGTEITLKHGEKLYPDGAVEQKQILRFLKTGEAQTDKYILKGTGIEVWNPRFVYHGFQYVEVSGLPVKPTKETLTGIVVYTSFHSTGDFACSNPLFNRIQEITRWSYIGNYHGIPTDCPHREKIGWTGDGHLVAETGLYNYNTVASYIKWLDDHVDEQQPDGNLPGVIPTSGWGYLHGRNESTRHLGYGPSWEGSLVLIPWYLYTYTGDTTILEKYYQPIKKYIDHLERNSKNYLLDFGIDDHKAYFTKTEGDIIATAYFYYLTELFAKMSRILNQEEDIKYYSKLASDIKRSFQAAYYDRSSKTVGNGGQTSLSMGLYMDLIPEKDQGQVLEYLLTKIDSADYHFDAGVGGVKALYETLSSAGQDQVIYQMVNQRDFPGYGYWIEQGANTLWQDWDGSMSLNHIMFGSVSEWFFQSLAGINPDLQHPGFKNVIINPAFVEDLQWASGEFEGPYGEIVSSWERKDDKVILRISIPVNSTASIHVPDGYEIISPTDVEIIDNQWKIPSGKYFIEMKR
jgi:alpha-L-rhamnosidase